jgi:EAL domain-containing protein (putative c-di-GMP-specific phosphodiesterase class I)/CheY-like chemotaxis protein
MKLVCLDDDRRLEPTLRRFAGRLGHQVHFHTASASFKAEVQTQPPDLVVLDLMLGHESGIAIIAWLAENRVRVPIVLLSGQGDELLDAARRIAEGSGIRVLGAVNKGQLVRDLPPLLAEGDRAARGPEAHPPAAGPGLTPIELSRSIREGRIEPCFQPLFSCDGRLRGAEVQVGLRLPCGDICPAPGLRPLAESAGLTLPLAEALFARIVALKAELKPLRLDLVSVGLSTAALERHPAIVLMRMLILVRSLIEGLAGCCRVRVELTETCDPADPLPAPDPAAPAGLLGGSLAVDDFGTGFACARALAELPFEALKTDLSGLSQLRDSPGSHNLLLASVALRRGLGLRLVLEGVERHARRRVILESGIDLAQGRPLGEPMDIQTLARALRPARRNLAPPGRARDLERHSSANKLG